MWHQELNLGPPHLVFFFRRSGPRYPLWKDDVPFSASEITSGSEVYEHDIECRAIEVIGQDWCSEVVALFPED